MTWDVPKPVAVSEGLPGLDRKGLEDFLNKQELAMSLEDLAFIQEYFKKKTEILPSPKSGTGYHHLTTAGTPP